MDFKRATSIAELVQYLGHDVVVKMEDGFSPPYVVERLHLFHGDYYVGCTAEHHPNRDVFRKAINSIYLPDHVMRDDPKPLLHWRAYDLMIGDPTDMPGCKIEGEFYIIASVSDMINLKERGMSSLERRRQYLIENGLIRPEEWQEIAEVKAVIVTPELIEHGKIYVPVISE